MKEMKKRVAKFYYKMAKVLFTISVLSILSIVALCSVVIELSDMFAWSVLIIVLIASAASAFYASIRIQKFLYNKGYLTKDDVIF